MKRRRLHNGIGPSDPLDTVPNRPSRDAIPTTRRRSDGEAFCAQTEGPILLEEKEYDNGSKGVQADFPWIRPRGGD